jgi:hypothetical protein
LNFRRLLLNALFSLVGSSALRATATLKIPGVFSTKMLTFSIYTFLLSLLVPDTYEFKVTIVINPELLVNHRLPGVGRIARQILKKKVASFPEKLIWLQEVGPSCEEK